MTLVVVSASKNIARIAQSVANEVIFVQPPESLDPRTLRDDVDEFYTLDHRDLSALTSLAERVLRPRAPAAVVSVAEAGLEPAALLSRALGTPATPVDVVRTILDKREMRRVLRQRAPHLTVDHADPGDVEQLRRLLAAHSRVIAKPVCGTASRGVHLVSAPEQVAALSVAEEYLCEAFAEGTEYSVETFSHAGEHDVIAIAEKGTADHHVEVSHLVSPALLDAGRTGVIERAVRELLDALGLRDGPSHTEVKVHGETVKVLETHNRPGGDAIADLVSLTTGLDWRRLSLEWPLGARPQRAAPQAVAAANVFLTARPGKVTEVREPPALPEGVDLSAWWIDVSPGDRVGPLRSSWDRVGMATITAPSVELCRRAVRTIRRAPVVVTEEGAR